MARPKLRVPLPEGQTLDLGCGKVKRGDVGMDVYPGPAVDVVHDLRDVPWPFPDASFARIISRHVLEHIPWTPEPQYDEALFRVMAEAWRVLKPGGVFSIEVPHQQSRRAFGVPTHRRVFDEISFTFFAKDLYHEQEGQDLTGRPLFNLSQMKADREFGNPLGLNEWHVERYLPRFYGFLSALRLGRKRNLYVDLVK